MRRGRGREDAGDDLAFFATLYGKHTREEYGTFEEKAQVSEVSISLQSNESIERY